MSAYNFGKINLPGPTGTYVYISVSGADAAGLAIGNYGDSDGDFHGFTANSGIPVIFDPTDSSNTDLGGITASGEIFGNYTNFTNQKVAFVYNNGVFTTIDAPLAQETTVFGVTNGEIFGGYVDLFGDSHGFLDIGGAFTQIDVPGATSTTVMGVTPSGDISGTTLDSSNRAHGFIDINGVFTAIDPAGSTGTYVVGISAAGVVAGTYYDSAQNSHGFVDANGLILTINIPGATETGVTGINASGEAVGYSIDSVGNIHGFVDNLGSVVTVDVPSATQTDIVGVNDAGDIYGYYNMGAVQYGFVGTSAGGTPTPTSAVAFPFADNYDITEAVYVGYFGRAGDPIGTSYWLSDLNNSVISPDAMAGSFSVQAEAATLYPFLASPTTATPVQVTSFIESVYQSLFNRAADLSGLVFWQNDLTANLGNPQSVGSFILAVINGAQGADQTTIADKVTVADFFTQAMAYSGLSFNTTADALAHSVITSVTSAFSTVTAAESTITAFLQTQSSAVDLGLLGLSHAEAASIGD
jgi:hypothetical protein